ncbi:molybdopterin-dependent oxidoreductase [Acaryochloris sp. IP29b_bin.148]|uniref:molybdopterin-dependent oxidoreductase n=1 Tax=Acaryochloris sp. IP29b_bin.148 TaxID=2969218 RepID=UPI00262F03A3|nr:molybdopterin-dependent oxidoreductase [Acaryochloris sp. IP29b_bin.148]
MSEKQRVPLGQHLANRFLVLTYGDTPHVISEIGSLRFESYTTNLALGDETTFFTHTLEEQPLPVDHGGPLRLVVPYLYAWKSGKWLNGLEFLDHETLGFWKENGSHRRGEPWAEERYSNR